MSAQPDPNNDDVENIAEPNVTEIENVENNTEYLTDYIGEETVTNNNIIMHKNLAKTRTNNNHTTAKQSTSNQSHESVGKSRKSSTINQKRRDGNPLLQSQSEKIDLIVSNDTQILNNQAGHILRMQTRRSTSQQNSQEEHQSIISHHGALITPDNMPTYQIPSSSQTHSQIPQMKKTVLEEHGFVLGRQIGSGTYAKVKIAHSREFQGPVAVKIISKIRAPHEYLTKFLPREIDVVRGLRHENLIRFYQSIETTHRVYIIMQFAEKGSLLDLIRQTGFLNESSARKFFQQLMNAVEYCHGQGVVHRDIKCENLLLDKDSNLKLIDFGFARKNTKSVDNRIILSDTYCGSYAYASPEVLKGTPYDPQMSDIWATGVVLFAMVFGRLPYDGSNYQQLLKQVQAKLIFPRSPYVPSACKALLLKILSPLKFRINIRVIRQDLWFSVRE